MSTDTSSYCDPEVDDCIVKCTASHAICLETIDHCLSTGGPHAEPGHMALLCACADMCATSAATLLRGASVSAVVCAACSRVCHQCASSCAAFAGDPALQRCADLCRRCAGSCAAMSTMPAH